MSRKNYWKVCWFCNSANLSECVAYVKCNDCGATWNPVPDTHGDAVTYKKDLAAAGVSGSPGPGAVFSRE